MELSAVPEKRTQRDSSCHPLGDTYQLSTPLTGPKQHRFQFTLANAFAIVTVACLGAALISWSPLVGGASFAFAVSVTSFTVVARSVSATRAHAMAIAGQVVGVTVNVPLICVGTLAAFVGMIQGTDTSVRENTLFAISGFGFLTIGVATCSALVASQREILRIALAVAYAANGILLAVALYGATHDDSWHNNI